MSLNSGDLTTLAVAKAYLGAAPSDQVLSGLITRISAWVRSSLNRQFLLPRTYTQQFDGSGTQALVLPEWPLLSLNSLSISGVSTPLSPQSVQSNIFSIPYGYRFQPWDGIPPGVPAVIELIGLGYYQGRQNVVATYRAGYATLDEAAQIPTSSPFVVTPQTPFGSWASDEGVTYNDGTPLVAVLSNPLVGQYVAPNPNVSPTPVLNYTFSSSDAGIPVILNYGYVPADLEQVTLELIAERSAYRSRVGVRSQMLASQESITYDTKGLPSYAVDMLLPYMSVLPPAMGPLL